MLDENQNNPLKTPNVGCVWKKKSKTGSTYYSGVVNGLDVLMFKNKSDSTKAPAFVFIACGKIAPEAIRKGEVGV